MDGATLGWLLDTDPALRWQVERDLAGEPPEVWEATRSRVATEGVGARLLACQDPDGRWAGGAYFPAEQPVVDGQPWTATTWSLNALREWGLDPAVLDGTVELLEANARWEYDDLPYWGGEVDCCINAWTVENGLWLGRDMDALAAWFPEHLLADGGWNCFWVDGATRSSFHSTLNSLHGLLAHERATGGTAETRAARRSGEEYLLVRGLLYRLSTGERADLADPENLAYPMRWRHDVLRGTEYFRQAARLDGDPPDPRLAEAVDRLRAAAGPDGRWVQGVRDPGAVWFEVDVPAGEPSPWLTFHASRVLAWWDG